MKTASLPDAPPRLLDDSGVPRFGRYRFPIEDTALVGLRHAGWGALARGFAARLLSEKRWSYVGVYGPRVIAACCVIDLGYLASTFAFALERTSGVLVEHHLIGPRLRRAVADTPVAGSARYGWPRSRVAIYADGLRRQVRAQLGRAAQALTFDLYVDERKAEGLSLVAPQGPGAFGYTYKAAGLPVSGLLQIAGGAVDLAGHRAAIDYTHGLPPRHLHWDWASGSGLADDGRSVAFNLVAGWNEEPQSENALWIDGRLQPLGRVRFEIAGDRWRIVGDRVDLRFEAEAERRQHVDLGLLASIYTQPLGRFDGTLLDADGGVLRCETVFGVTEDHRARW